MKDIAITKKIQKVAVPNRRSINFAEVGVTPMKMEIIIPSIIGIVVVAALLSKFFVVDRLVAVGRLSAEVSAMQGRLTECNEEIDSYGQMAEKFAHYTYSGMTPAELSLQDRVAIVELINKYILGKAEVGSWTITDNEVSVPITGVTFQEVGQIVAAIEGDDMVDHCEVLAAATNDSKLTYDSTKSDMTTLSGSAGATAQVTIFLKDAGAKEVSGQ